MYIEAHVNVAEKHGWESYVRAFRLATQDEYRTGLKAEHVEHFILSKSKRDGKETPAKTIENMRSAEYIPSKGMSSVIAALGGSQ